MRQTHFVPQTGRLIITDRSDREVHSRFNLHPDVQADEISDHELLLKGRRGSLRVRHDGRRVWNERWIATENFKRTPIRQLEIVGNPVHIEMDLPPAASLPQSAVGTGIDYPKRLELSKELSRKYRVSSLSRAEAPGRFIMQRIVMLAAIGFAAGLLLFAPLAALGWISCAAAGVFLAGDIATEGFLTTGLIALAQQLRI